MMADETVAERLRRETIETEALGTEWAKRSDEYLVGYVSQQRGSQFHTPALVEIQRRQIIATRVSSAESSRQAAQMLALTRWIIGLTIVLAIIAVLQLLAMVWPKGGA